MLRQVTFFAGLWLSGCAEGTEPSPFSASGNGEEDSGTPAAAEADGGGPSTPIPAPVASDADAGPTDAPENPSPPRCQPGDPSGFDPPAPTPRISLGKPVVTSEGVDNPDGLVDGDYHDSATITHFGSPTADAPSFAAIDLGVGPERVLALWHDASYLLYNDPVQGSPSSYRIETSADSSDGIDGEWIDAEEVSDNRQRARAHAVEFSGMRWLRFVFTSTTEDSTRGEVNLDEIAVHDISAAEDEMIDAWFFMGDSITQGAFKRDFPEEQMFDELVATSVPDTFPAMVNGGIGGELLNDALARIDLVLTQYPHFRYVTVAFGTNDAWGNKSVAAAGFEANLVELVERILDAGHVPVIARIPFADAAHDTLPEFNAVIDQVREDYELPCGPDLYSWFWEHQEQLGDDKVHPIQSGNMEINRLWAEAAAAYYESN